MIFGFFFCCCCYKQVECCNIFFTPWSLNATKIFYGMCVTGAATTIDGEICTRLYNAMQTHFGKSIKKSTFLIRNEWRCYSSRFQYKKTVIVHIMTPASSHMTIIQLLLAIFFGLVCFVSDMVEYLMCVYHILFVGCGVSIKKCEIQLLGWFSSNLPICMLRLYMVPTNHAYWPIIPFNYNCTGNIIFISYTCLFEWSNW